MKNFYIKNSYFIIFLMLANFAISNISDDSFETDDIQFNSFNLYKYLLNNKLHEVNSHEVEDDVLQKNDAWRIWQIKHILIKQWFAQQEKNLKLKINNTIVYPFGGGDILYPISFFPNFHKLIIIGLEPVGKGYSLQARDGLISNFNYLCRHGNFVTRDMEAFVKSGILTMILLQLQKLGIKNIKYIAWRNKVTFSFMLGGIERKIIYIKANLGDKFYNVWANMFQEHNNFTLYMKSASFILHQPGFAKIRNLFLEKADIIVQDDTGFKYSDLKHNNFIIHLYGSYYLPYTIVGLEKFFQQTLKEAYEVSNVGYLPFAIGYRCQSVEGNLLIAYKNQPL